MTRPAVAKDDLAQFQTELAERRARLQRLLDDDARGHGPLADEVAALTEQLSVAGEELRVQQEELADTGRRAARLAAERDAWFELSHDVLVLTDRHGSVHRANAAAQRLIALPSARRQPRPIATWFDPQDRPAVRGLIARVTRTRHPAAGKATVLTADGARIPTDLILTYLPPAVPDGDIGLQWVLQPAESAPASPAVTAETSTGARAEVFAALAQELAAQPTRESLAAAVVRAATRIIPQAEDAGLTVFDRSGHPILLESTSPAAEACEQAQTAHAPARRAGFAGAAAGRPGFLQATDAVGIRSVLSVPLELPRPYTGVLSCYNRLPGVFTELEEHTAAIFGVHAALAVARSLSDDNLRAAVATRQLIGQAVGILIERRKLTAEAAFDQLVKASQTKHVKLREVAVAVVETGLDPSETWTA